MGYSDTFTLEGVTINVVRMSPVRKQRQRKMVVGKQLNLIDIVGVNLFQWEIDIEAVVTGTNATTLASNRESIENLNDLETHAWVDGLHDGTYYMIPDSLIFNDSGERGNMSYTVRFKIVEA